MTTPRQQRELLNAGVFVSHLNNALRHLNRRWGTTVVVDDASAVRAHDDWLRSIVFALIHRAIPSFFEEPDVEAVSELCLTIQANGDEARHWRRIVGYPPLESGAD